MKKRRCHAIFARWVDVIAYGAIAGLAWYVFAPAIESLSAPLVNLVVSVPLWPKLAFWVSVGGVSLWLAGRHRWMGLLGFRHLLSFPPLWLSILIAALTAVTINTLWARDPFLKNFTLDVIYATSYFSADHAAYLGAVGIALLALHAIRRRRAPHVGEAPTDSAAGPHRRSDWKEQLQTLEGLKKWALTDREVTHPRQDLFDHDSIAQRIAQRLADNSPEVAPTMAVVGIRGSGKSTIGRLVEHHLRSNPRMLFVKLSLWLFDSTEAAVRGILNELVRALGTRVNTLSLTGLPGHYAATVEKLGPWASILGLFRQSPNPKDIIEQVARIALATDARIVLWIEDLERFSGIGTMEDEGAALREGERLGPIRSLLWLLNECEHIGVVVADSSLRSRFDVEKIARFVERVPPLDLYQAGKVIGFFRNECLNGYPKAIIDPIHPDERDKFRPSEPLVRSISSYLSSEQEPEPFDALIEVVRTPRSLKNVLRWTMETWEQLPGEIDLDHVIAASALRSSYPEVFEFVDTNVDWFRRGFRTASSEKNDPVQHQAYLAFKELLAQPPLQAASSAITSLVRFIFPAFPQHQVIPDIDRYYLTRPQGLNIAEPVDYWSRYLRCAPVPDDHSDQRVLRQIQAWKEEKENDLVSYLIDENSNGQVESFLNQFNFFDLLRLLPEVVKREQGEGVARWSEFLSPPGGVSVWRMLNRRDVRDSKRVASTLEELLKDLVPSHLPYASFLLQYFCIRVQGSTVFPLTEQDDTKRLAELVLNRLRESFPPGNASALRNALQGAHPYLLRNFFQDIKHGCGFTGDLPMGGWEQFAKTLLELAHLDPPIGIPIVLTFVTSSSYRMAESLDDETGEYLGPTRVPEYQFQEDKAKKLFDWNRLRPLLVEHCIPNEIEAGIGLMWKTARQAVSP